MVLCRDYFSRGASKHLGSRVLQQLQGFVNASQSAFLGRGHLVVAA
jgi:hypothetical protein